MSDEGSKAGGPIQTFFAFVAAWMAAIAVYVMIWLPLALYINEPYGSAHELAVDIFSFVVGALFGRWLYKQLR